MPDMRRARLLPGSIAALCILAWAWEAARTAPAVTITRHYTSADRESGRYQYVPFTVPAGTGMLRVTYQYDRADGENVVDLGVFEPGPLDLGTPAFRGYSGGSKPGFTISANETTPGYRPGPLPAGEWHVLLGLYKVRDAGVDVTITVHVEPGPSPVAPPEPPAGPRARSGTGDTGDTDGRWYMGALHTHTVHSDGELGAIELLRRFGDAGFDFVAITDHNNTTHTHAIASQHPTGARPLWIVGEEVTTPGGHANVWGLQPGGWVDFRVMPGDRRIADLVAAARHGGALFSINHPVSQCAGCGWEHEIIDGIDGIEISNGQHAEVDASLAVWDRLLVAGRRITGVGSSDWHRPPQAIDRANVRVFAERLTTAAVLEAIRAGRVIVMRSARDATPDILVSSGAATARVGDMLRIADSAILVEARAPELAGGRLVVVSNGVRREPVPLDARGHLTTRQQVTPGYVRFEIYAADGALVAISNPVYLMQS
jgi:hypothetical protein